MINCYLNVLNGSKEGIPEWVKMEESPLVGDYLAVQKNDGSTRFYKIFKRQWVLSQAPDLYDGLIWGSILQLDLK